MVACMRKEDKHKGTKLHSNFVPFKNLKIKLGFAGNPIIVTVKPMHISTHNGKPAC